MTSDCLWFWMGWLLHFRNNIIVMELHRYNQTNCFVFAQIQMAATKSFLFFFCFLHNEFIAIIWCTNVTVANVNNYFFQAALRFISVISIVWLPPWMFFFCRNKKHWTKEYKQMLPCSYWVECQSIKNSCVYFCHVWKNCNLYGQ